MHNVCFSKVDFVLNGCRFILSEINLYLFIVYMYVGEILNLELTWETWVFPSVLFAMTLTCFYCFASFVSKMLEPL